MSAIEHSAEQAASVTDAAKPDAAAENKPAAPSNGAAGGGSGGEDAPSKLTAVYKSSTEFMGLVGKEWLSSLLSQPADPPFCFDATFPDGPVRIMRLVVMSVILTGLVVLSEQFLSKSTPTLVLSMAIKVVIGSFLVAIVYTLFAFVCGVRVYQTTHRRLTLGQIFFSVLYILVPWIPIFAFLWSFAGGGGTLRLLLMLALFYLCVGYVIFNFARALSRITRCPAYRVWLSVLLPVAAVASYVLLRG